MSRPLARCRHSWTALAVAAWWIIAGPACSVRAQGVSNPTIRDSNVGYIDGAIPGNEFRFRFDTSNDDPRPSRAEFFYAKSGPFNPGPADTEKSVDFQELSAKLELLLLPGLSGFVEVPVRFVQFQDDPSQSGLSDINAGFKYAFINQEDLVTSFQFRTYVPTGDSFKGLGTHHTSLEPAFLFYDRLTDRLSAEGELRDWIPIGGTDFSGNILRIGAGLSYSLYQRERFQIVPVAEMVGWAVLSGKDFEPLGGDAFQTIDAAGQFILNAKLGCRFKFGDWGELYTGYGRPLTGDRWYANTFRLEFRLLF